MKKRLLAGLLATSIALSISMGAFPAMAATNDDFVEDREDIADYTDDSYSSGYSSSEQLFDDIIFFDLDEEVDDTAAEVIAEEDANDSSDTEIDRAADSIEETEPEDEVQNTDAAEDRNDREYPDEETKSGTNPGEAGPSDAETEEDVPDSWEETPKIDSELEAAIASEDPFSYYDDDASEEEMDDDIALLAAGKTMAHEDYAYTDVSSGTEYMVDLYTDHTAKIWKLTTSSGEAECILPSTIYYTDADGVPEPTPYTVTELRLSYWSGVTSDNNNYTALVLPDTLTDIGGSLSGFKNVTEITIPGSVKVFNATLQNMKQLKTLTFDEGVEEIASGSVVSGCKSLTTIHLPSSEKKPDKIRKLVDIQANVAAGKGIGYERWAKKFNLKNWSQTLCLLQEKKLLSEDALYQRIAELQTQHDDALAVVKDLDARMVSLKELRGHLVVYRQYKPLAQKHQTVRNPAKFKEQHRAEFAVYEAACAYFKANGLRTLPDLKKLDAEYQTFSSEKNGFYTRYKKAQIELRELRTAQQNVEAFFRKEERSHAVPQQEVK